MQTTISIKFQVVIPKAARKRLNLRPQQKLTVIEKDGLLILGGRGSGFPYCRYWVRVEDGGIEPRRRKGSKDYFRFIFRMLFVKGRYQKAEAGW